MGGGLPEVASVPVVEGLEVGSVSVRSVSLVAREVGSVSPEMMLKASFGFV